MLGQSRELKDTEIIEDLQTQIKEMVSVAVRSIGAMVVFRARLERLLDKGLEEVSNEELRETARKSLEEYAFKQINEMNLILGLQNIPLIAGLTLDLGKDTKKQLQRNLNEIWSNIGIDRINKGYSQLGNSKAMKNNHESLRGHAELVARFEKREEMLNNLKGKTNLVICDTHSDCSERCSKWQGKIYSLDGTYGKTKDGKSYQPLENATDIYDKYGYKNGLLGFNCRHKLHPYSVGMSAIRVSAEERKREYAITLEQRKLERAIRHAKDMAYTYKDSITHANAYDKATLQYMQNKYNMYKLKVKVLTQEYNAFCDKYNRTKYRSRLTI